MCLLYSLFFDESIFRTFILSSSAIFRKSCNVFVHFSPRLSLNNGRHEGFPEFNICFPDLHNSDGLEMWHNLNDFPLFSIRPFHCSGVLCCIDNHLEKTLVKAGWVWWYEMWKDAMLLKMKTPRIKYSYLAARIFVGALAQGPGLHGHAWEIHQELITF